MTTDKPVMSDSCITLLGYYNVAWQWLSSNWIYSLYNKMTFATRKIFKNTSVF